jgi:hypothetical protein
MAFHHASRIFGAENQTGFPALDTNQRSLIFPISTWKLAYYSETQKALPGSASAITPSHSESRACHLQIVA